MHQFLVLSLIQYLITQRLNGPIYFRGKVDELTLDALIELPGLAVAASVDRGPIPFRLSKSSLFLSASVVELNYHRL